MYYVGFIQSGIHNTIAQVVRRLHAVQVHADQSVDALNGVT